MYLIPLKTALVEALREVFDEEYPVDNFRDLKVSIEFPTTPADYPGIWVNYDDTASLTTAGIDHEEIITDSDGTRRFRRWRFEGTITLTMAAMSSRERDRLYDEVVRVFAFGRYEESTSQFRDKIENNDWIAMTINFDDLRPSGDNSAAGTPWQTTEVIYEKSLSMDVIGEFIGDPSTAALVNLGEVRVYPYVEGIEVVPNPAPDAGHEATPWR